MLLEFRGWPSWQSGNDLDLETGSFSYENRTGTPTTRLRVSCYRLRRKGLKNKVRFQQLMVRRHQRLPDRGSRLKLVILKGPSFSKTGAAFGSD
jgi:hypothetical protein